MICSGYVLVDWIYFTTPEVGTQVKFDSDPN